MSRRLRVDEGLQPERTELAWQRTALSIAVGSLVLIRLLPAMFGDSAWIVPGIAGFAIAGGLWLASQRRYAAEGPMPGRPEPASPGGGLLLGLTAVTVLFGVLGLGIVVLAVTH